jgi:hypothetical protein
MEAQLTALFLALIYDLILLSALSCSAPPSSSHCFSFLDTTAHNELTFFTMHFPAQLPALPHSASIEFSSLTLG